MRALFVRPLLGPLCLLLSSISLALCLGCEPQSTSELVSEQPASAASTNELPQEPRWKPVVSKAADVEIKELRKVIPAKAGALLKEVVPQAANNNLDIIDFEGRFFLAFRTAPSHFASEKALLYNYSSDVDGPDRSWLSGQASPTFIYSMLLLFQ